MFRGLRKGHQEMVRNDQSLGAELQQKVALEQRHPDGGSNKRVRGMKGGSIEEECLRSSFSLG